MEGGQAGRARTRREVDELVRVAPQVVQLALAGGVLDVREAAGAKALVLGDVGTGRCAQPQGRGRRRGAPAAVRRAALVDVVGFELAGYGVVTALPDDDAVVDAHPERDPAARAEASVLRDRLEGALEGLPPKLRAVVVLRDVYDLPHESIAAELGISESAAKVRLHRARRKLREDLYPMPDDAGAGERSRAV